MSPNESQLRAALHDGEGDSPDADALISHALRVRHDHRRRFNAIAGGVAAAAFVGVGATALVALGGNGGKNGSSGGYAASEPRADLRTAANAAGGASNSKTASGAPTPGPAHGSASSGRAPIAQAKGAATGFAAALRCPATPDRLLLPGGGGSGQFGSTDPLFAGDVAAMRVCGYPLRAGADTRSVVVSDPEASGLATSLEAEPATRSGGGSCPANTDFAGGTVEILGVNARGTALKPVVITLACMSSQATNGTAVRYLDNLPDRFLRLLATTPTKSLSNTSPGQVHASPVH